MKRFPGARFRKGFVKMKNASSVMAPPGAVSQKKSRRPGKKGFIYEITHNALLYLLVTPAILYTIIFKYLPMAGIVIAFQNYNPLKGITGSELIGFKNFRFFFRGSQWLSITFNTIFLNSVFIITGTIATIAIAVIMTELSKGLYVRFAQSAMILPNFLAWAVVAMFAQVFIGSEGGVINKLIEALGGEGIGFYSTSSVWPGIFVIVRIWKGAGFGAIVYMAAIMGIDTEIYEAAMLDGASRMQRIFRITIPLLKDTVILLTILNVGSIFVGDFGMIYTFIGDNTMLYSTTDVIDTYVFRSLRSHGSMGMSAAVGLYQSVFNFLFVVVTNAIAKKLNPQSAIF